MQEVEKEKQRKERERTTKEKEEGRKKQQEDRNKRNEAAEKTIKAHDDFENGPTKEMVTRTNEKGLEDKRHINEKCKGGTRKITEAQ